MAKSVELDIRYSGCEIIVHPTQQTINQKSSAREMSSQISRLLDEPRQDMLTELVVDFGSIAWISSVGLNELIRIRHRSHASGISIKLRAANASVRDVFRITRLERMFEFVADEDSPRSAAVESSASS